jgi:hypothetical protein
MTEILIIKTSIKIMLCSNEWNPLGFWHVFKTLHQFLFKHFYFNWTRLHKHCLKFFWPKNHFQGYCAFVNKEGHVDNGLAF